MNITIATYINGSATISMNTPDYDILSRTPLKGCPFKDYFAYDLLRDLLQMYSWRLKPGIYYTIGEFLDICNDAHAIAYRNIFTD